MNLDARCQGLSLEKMVGMLISADQTRRVQAARTGVNILRHKQRKLHDGIDHGVTEVILRRCIGHLKRKIKLRITRRHGGVARESRVYLYGLVSIEATTE